jgi:hypothetical protein
VARVSAALVTAVRVRAGAVAAASVAWPVVWAGGPVEPAVRVRVAAAWAPAVGPVVDPVRAGAEPVAWVLVVAWVMGSVRAVVA